jgi:adenylate cyclase
MQFRIGVHVGDVMVDGENLLGDGVNIAARLEALAEPGAIYVSAVVRDSGWQQAAAGLRRPRRPPPQEHRPADPGVSGASRKAGAQPAAALPLPDKPSIAVLPFQNMSGDPEQEYFADEMVEITAALCRVRDFFVIARDSAFSYKGRAVPAQQVSREPGVRCLIEGSVRRGGALSRQDRAPLFSRRCGLRHAGGVRVP